MEAAGVDPATEEWRPVVGYEGLYSVSNLGRVRSEERVIVANGAKFKGWVGRRRQRLMRPTPNGWGYLQVNLTKDRARQTFAVHLLVAEAFIGPRPAGLLVLHGPLGQEVNSVGNLSYGTPSENIGRDRRRDGTLLCGERHGRAKLTLEQVKEIRASRESHAALGRRFGVSNNTIRLARIGRNWKHVA